LIAFGGKQMTDGERDRNVVPLTDGVAEKSHNSELKTKIAFVVFAAIACLGMLSYASAYNEADLQKLKTTKNCSSCDLSWALLMHSVLPGADLSGANLTGANLTGAFLRGANLSGANLTASILRSASLNGANLMGARLGGANLLFTDFAGATWVDGSRCESHSSGWCRR
jgi:uncharacterized protein YjbI with pentapeptide repeats